MADIVMRCMDCNTSNIIRWYKLRFGKMAIRSGSVLTGRGVSLQQAVEQD